MFAFHRESKPREAGEGVTRRVLAHSPGMMLCELTMEQGSVIGQHTHPHEQITYVLSGRCRYTVGEQTREVGPGDSVLIPGGLPHSLTVLADLEVIDVFAPAREDFI